MLNGTASLHFNQKNRSLGVGRSQGEKVFSMEMQRARQRVV